MLQGDNFITARGVLNGIRIVCASGKGGTGKTTVATNLAFSIASSIDTSISSMQAVTYCDCDVEEPNGHIFLSPRLHSREEIAVPVPAVDESKCTGCGACSELCQYNAIMATKRSVLIFPQMCHGCAGCWLICPHGALKESRHVVGIIEQGDAGQGTINFMQGRLRIGEPRPVPLIRELKGRLPERGVAIIDAPPGTSCPVIESVRDADLLLLVAEPTPFGLYDLKLTTETAKRMSMPYAVMVNRTGTVENGLFEEYCRSEDISPILGIPNDRRIAEAYSKGELIIRSLPEYRDLFSLLWERLKVMLLV